MSSNEYKHTLNLPTTDFAMKASLAQREPQWLAQWQQDDLYQQIRKARQGAPSFILHDGPPYANGELHCGHVLNKVLKDIILKAKTLSGFDAPLVPGWDCHGLPIELNVEKKVGKAGQKVSTKDFRTRCRAYASEQWQGQRSTFERFGVIADWQAPYLTMDFTYEANIIRALAVLIDKGHVYQGAKPVYWCLDCGSALAEAEVEYEEKISPAIDVGFVVVAPEDLPFPHQLSLEKPVMLPIWTTTPWTLPANQAVALHPEITYVYARLPSQPYDIICARQLVNEVTQRYGETEPQLEGSCLGDALEAVMLQHPLFDDVTVPVIMADHVSDDAGTGCVHTAPAHGPDDFQAAKPYGLPINNPVMSNGCYTDETPHVAGLHVRKADPVIIQLLADRNTLLANTQIKHSYPHCWRHKTPVIYRATPQWFISMDKLGLRDLAYQACEEVTFLPDWGRARIQGMIEGRPDWCISRQRYWGVPIAVFIHRQTGELHPRTNALMAEVANLVENNGIDAWFDLDPQTLLGEEAGDYDKVTDVLDVWFDSGVSHYAVLSQHLDLHFPADLYLEGSDQHRGWFNSSLTTACAMTSQAPYRSLLTHGFTVDAQGKKMSKSKGNFLAPAQLLKTYGADIMRLWVLSTDYRGEVHLSDKVLKQTADAYRRIRNTCRYLLSNLFDFDPAQDAVDIADLTELDRWAIATTQQTQQAIVSDYDNYDFHQVFERLYRFCAVDMGSFYLDIIKDRQYTTPKQSRARRACQTAMWIMLEALVRWMAPVLSFTAQEVWQAMGKEGYVFASLWFEDFPDLTVDMARWQQLRQCRDQLNKQLEGARQQGLFGAALEADVTLFADPQYYTALHELGDELRFLLITSGATVAPYASQTPQAVATDLPGLACEIRAASSQKCARCWHRRSDVGLNPQHPTLCQRCIDNISGREEQRLWV